jgi:hypothetical protein
MRSPDTPDSSDICRHQAVANSPLGNITVCPHCAVVHVAIGHVTMRFTTEAFRDLGSLVALAQASLGAPAQDSAPMPSFVMPPVGRIQ